MSRPTSEAADFKAMLFRLPPHLEAYIRDEAAAHGRPLNTQVVWMLEHLRQHPVDLKPPRKQHEREPAHV
jgi:hypothetical protein